MVWPAASITVISLLMLSQTAACSAGFLSRRPSPQWEVCSPASVSAGSCLPAMLHGSIPGKRKPCGVCLRRAFVEDVVSYESNLFVWVLLQQRHPLRVGIPTAADDTVKVYAAGQKIQKRWHLAPLHNSTLVLARERVLRHT